MTEISLLQSQMLKLSAIEPNKGQIEGLPKNPRFIKDTKFKKLVQSIEDHPEMTAMRELLVYPLENGKYIIIGGNMRYRAMKEIGIKESPCKVIPQDTTIEQLQAYTLKDNSGYGEWDFDLLANEWDLSMLEDCAIDLPIIADTIDEMPLELDEEDKNEPFSIKITFVDDKSLKRFAQEYEESIKAKYNCRIVYRGGEL